MNPKDIMTDAIHNFHPQYQQYTQYSAGMYYFLYLYDFLISFMYCYNYSLMYVFIYFY